MLDVQNLVIVHSVVRDSMVQLNVPYHTCADCTCSTVGTAEAFVAVEVVVVALPAAPKKVMGL